MRSFICHLRQRSVISSSSSTYSGSLFSALQTRQQSWISVSKYRHNRLFSSSSSSSSTLSSENNNNHNKLHVPNKQDAEELWKLLNLRPGSIISTLLGNDNDDDQQQQEERMEKYNNDWLKRYKGNSKIVVKPKSTKEVSAIVQYCYQRHIPIVPQGGNTGLVGGSVPIYDNEIILSLEYMNHIEGFISSSASRSPSDDDDDDDENNDANNELVSNNNDDGEINDSGGSSGSILIAQAGCILQDLQDYASKHNHLLPVDLGAKGTCQIGGNVSTNAGGSYYYRYGSLHANIIGLEVVVPNEDGEILNLNISPYPHLKDNTIGYDMKHLFIGSEGTLGIITRVAIHCPTMPTSKCVMMISCNTFTNILRILSLAKQKHLNEVLAAFEFMDQQVLTFVQSYLQGSSSSSSSSSTTSSSRKTNTNSLLSSLSMESYTILIETHGSNEYHDNEKVENFLNELYEQNLISNGMVAQNIQQGNEMWSIRELCNPSTSIQGYTYKYDISLPLSDFPYFIQQVRTSISKMKRSETANEEEEEEIVCANWGHIVDGNLHCNILIPGKYEKDDMLYEQIEELIFHQVIDRYDGSISAEHGLGQYKNKYLSQIDSKRPLLRHMEYIKMNWFDRRGVLNPGKYLPQK